MSCISFVCGCRDLGEALHKVREGAAMIRTKGKVGMGNVVEAVHHVRSVMGNICALRNMDDDDEVFMYAKRIAVPYNLIMQNPKQWPQLEDKLSWRGGVVLWQVEPDQGPTRYCSAWTVPD